MLPEQLSGLLTLHDSELMQAWSFPPFQQILFFSFEMLLETARTGHDSELVQGPSFLTW